MITQVLPNVYSLGWPGPCLDAPMCFWVWGLGRQHGGAQMLKGQNTQGAAPSVKKGQPGFLVLASKLFMKVTTPDFTEDNFIRL